MDYLSFLPAELMENGRIVPWMAVTLSGFLLICESEAGDLAVDWGRGRRRDKSMNPQKDTES